MQANWTTAEAEIDIRSGAGEIGEQVTAVLLSLVRQVMEGAGRVDEVSHSICRTPSGGERYLVTVLARQWKEIEVRDK